MSIYVDLKQNSNESVPTVYRYLKTANETVNIELKNYLNTLEGMDGKRVSQLNALLQLNEQFGNIEIEKLIDILEAQILNSFNSFKQFNE